MTTETIIERLGEWCRAEHFEPVPTSEPGTIIVAIEPDGGLDVQIEAGDGRRPVRFRQQFDLEVGADLGADRLTEIIDHAIRQRSTMIDARVVAGPRADVVVSVYPDGLSQHSFMTAIYECQKLRDTVVADVRAAAVADTTVAALQALTDEVWGSDEG